MLRIILETFVNVMVAGLCRIFIARTPNLPKKLFMLSGTSQVCAKAFSSLALASGVSLASFSSITYGGFKENDLLVKLGAAGAIASISFGILNHFLLKGDLIKQEVQQDYNTKVAKDLLPMLKKTPSQIAPPKQENN